MGDFLTVYHKPVLKQELKDLLGAGSAPRQWAIDCTAGFGGHTACLLESFERVIALDQDPDAISYLKARFSQERAQGRLIIMQENFRNLYKLCEKMQLVGQISAICADLGVSSYQLDQPNRGFSFLHDGPLDMRMDPTQELTAADIVNHYSLNDLAKLFRKLGEEPKAYIVARAIVQAREKKPFTRTKELADLIAQTIHYRERSRTHKATRCFQALRIAVNDELAAIEALLQQAFDCLTTSGRLAVISFHSLEDRLVKRFFKSLTQRNEMPEWRSLPMIVSTDALARIVKPFPLRASSEEIKNNPRSRSALLRVIEKC